MRHPAMLFFIAIVLLSASCQKSCQRKAKDTAITVDVGFPIESLDPRYATSAVAARVAKLVYAPLFIFDEHLMPQPFLVESFSLKDDKSYSFVLRPNLKFHNGSPLTSDDVIYTLQELSSKDVLSPFAEKLNYIKAFQKINELEFAIELNESHAPFLTDLIAMGIVSKKSCENRSAECRHEYNGSGPFKVVSFNEATETLKLAPFSGWFEGAPHNNIVVRVVRDENTRVLELLGKKAHIVDSDISPQNIEKLSEAKFLTVKQIPGLGYSYFAFNVRGPMETMSGDLKETLTALKEPKVREAIAHAIDFDLIINKVLLKAATRASGLIPNNHWAKDNSLKAPSFDPQKAETLLDDAGFKRKPNGTRFKLTITTSQDRMRQSIAALYADYLKKVGIDTSIRIKDFSALYQDMKKGQFEAFSAIWVPVTDPDLYRWVHHSKNIPSEERDGGNRHGYQNPEVDKLIEEGQHTLDNAKRAEIYKLIEQIMVRDLPYVPLWNENRIVVVNEEVKDYGPSSTGSLLGLRKAFIETK